jgi:hypothetical protein
VKPLHRQIYIGNPFRWSAWLGIPWRPTIETVASLALNVNENRYQFQLKPFLFRAYPEMFASATFNPMSLSSFFSPAIPRSRRSAE